MDPNLINQSPASPQNRESEVLKQQMEVLKFLREESEANRKAQREDADANRKLLTDTFKAVSPVIAVVIALAGFLWFHDLNTLKQSLRDEGESETKLEISKMDKQIDDTLTSRFQDKNIEHTIHEAAVTATKAEAKPLIEAGVKSQVREAVAQQGSLIQRIAKEAVNAKVGESITPLAAKIKESSLDLQIQQLIARADSDDALALDKLAAEKPTLSKTQQQLIETVITDRRQHANQQGITINNEAGCLDPDVFLFPILASDGVESRATAIRNYSGCHTLFWEVRNDEKKTSVIDIEQKIVPHLVKAAQDDPSLQVRASAVTTLNAILRFSAGFPKHGIRQVDVEDLKTWWAQHRGDYRTMVLQSLMLSNSNGPDMAALYEAMLSEMPNASRESRSLLQELTSYMQRSASRKEERDGLRRKLGRDSCESVNSDFDARLSSWNREPANEQVDDYGLLEMQFLLECPKIPKFLPNLVEIATKSSRLSHRYAATALLNRWEGEQLLPFNSSTTEQWWKARSSSRRDKGN